MLVSLASQALNLQVQSPLKVEGLVGTVPFHWYCHDIGLAKIADLHDLSCHVISLHHMILIYHVTYHVMMATAVEKQEVVYD